MAKVWKVPKEVIESLTEEGVIAIVANTFHEGPIGYQKSEHCTFIPLETLIKLYEEKIALYKRIITEKEARINRMQRN